MFGSVRRSQGRTTSLEAAAQSALDCARRERLPLAHIAEREGNALYWFANSILATAQVEGRSAQSGAMATLSRDACKGAVLDSDLRALRAPGASEPRFVDLRIGAHDLAKYLGWARSVQ